jgi:large subunit ribosomal protein L9
MEVLLLEGVPGLGRAGEVVSVAPGYARNYLLPKKLARLVTEGVLKQVRVEQAAQARHQRLVERRLEELAERLDGLQVHLAGRVGEEERLYGSITSQDIASALEELVEEPVDRRRIELEEPIRELGTHRVTVRLRADLAPRISVVVDSEEEE